MLQCIYMRISIAYSLIFIIAFSFAPQKSEAQLAPIYDTEFKQLNFTGGTYINGTGSGALTVGAKYRYDNVIAVGSSTTTVRAIVEIKEMTNRTIADFDPGSSSNVVCTDTSSGNPNQCVSAANQANWFILTTGASGGGSNVRGHIKLEFSFINQADDTPLRLQNVAVNSFDIDGTGSTAPTGSHPTLNFTPPTFSDGAVNQFTEFGGFQLSELSTGTLDPYESPSVLYPSYNALTGLTTFVSLTNLNNNQAPGTAAGDRFRVRVLYDELSVFEISMGSYSNASTFGLQFALGPQWASPPEMTRTPELTLSLGEKDRTIEFSGEPITFSDNGEIFPLTTGLSNPGNPGEFLNDPAPIVSGTIDNLKINYTLASIQPGERLLIDGVDMSISLSNKAGGTFSLAGVPWKYASSTAGAVKTLTFTKDGAGKNTRAQYEALLNALQYYNSAPNEAVREFELTIEDAGYTSPTAVFTIDILEDAEPDIAESMIKVSPTSTLQAELNQTLNDNLVVRVSDEEGNDVVGADVVFAITSGTGLLGAPTTVQTNSSGTATFSGGWTLNSLGEHVVTATLYGVGNTVTFNAIGSVGAVPVISDIETFPGTSGATITWLTDELASTKVVYSTDNQYASSTSETDTDSGVLEHSKSISNLLACTLYNFKVISADEDGNYATSSPSTFLTTGCSGGAVPSSVISNSINVSAPTVVTGTNSGRAFTVDAPAGFTDDWASIVIQIKGLDSATVLGSIGKPFSSLSSAASVVFDVKALVNNVTELDSFDHPVTISYTYTDADVNGLDENSLSMYHYAGGVWQELDNCSVNTATNTITCTAPHFSIFAIFGNSLALAGDNNETNGRSSTRMSGITFGCKDPKASNYNHFTSHKQELCQYKIAQSDTTQPIPTKSVAVDSVCAPHIKTYIRYGADNDVEDVRKLETFLNEKQGEALAVDGVYSLEDMEAVKRFQQKYASEVLNVWGVAEPTGYVYRTTLMKINSFYCSASITCPAFTEHNSLTENPVSTEVVKTKTLLTELGFYSGVVNNTFDNSLDISLKNFQQTFSDTMLKPWGLTSGTGYKYKTTNKFLNMLVGCQTPAVELDGRGTFDY